MSTTHQPTEIARGFAAPKPDLARTPAGDISMLAGIEAQSIHREHGEELTQEFAAIAAPLDKSYQEFEVSRMEIATNRNFTEEGRSAEIATAAQPFVQMISQIEKRTEILDEEVEMRQRVAKQYDELLAQSSEVISPHIESHNLSAFAQYTIRIENRAAVRSKLKQLDIPTAVHYPVPLNKQPAVSNQVAYLPVSEEVSGQVVSLPMHPYLETDDQDRVVSALQGAVVIE